MIGILPTKTIIQNGQKVEVVDLSSSNYNPPDDIKALTAKVQQDYQMGYQINHRAFREFNDMDLITRMDVDQKAWNGYVQPKTDDPEEDWRWNGVTDITRNKVLLTAAHLTSGMMYPGVFAQNNEDEEDRTASYVMGDAMEWNIQHSDYEMTFLYGVIAALVNPVAYIKIEYNKEYQSIKEKNEQGIITAKSVLDEINSGFQFHNIPADEILISNAYQYYIQKQRFIIHKRYIDYDEAKAKYGEHSNFQYVSPGIKIIFSGKDGMFYEQINNEAPTLCEEVIYYNRREDIEVPFINGIYVGDSDVNANLIRHRDNENRPKYPFVKFGAEPIDEKRFYFYKSYAAKLSNKQELIDQVWRTLVDAMTQETRPPLAVIGGGDVIEGNISYPGSQHQFGPDTKIETIGLTRNITLASQVMELIKQQMSEDTQSDQLGGKYEGGDKTKFEVAKIEANARINLGLLGRMIVGMVRDVGDLVVDDIVINQTTGEIDEITSEGVKLKYRSYLLPDKSEGGKQITEKIQFDGSLIGRKMTEREELKESFKLKKTKDEKGVKLIKVNPVFFSRLKFLIILEAESWMPRNKKFEEMMQLEKYDRLIASPLTDQEQVTLDFLLKPLVKGDSSKYMRKDKEEVISQMMKPKGSSMGEAVKAMKAPEAEIALME